MWCSCLRNVVTLFHVVDKELEWRRKQGERTIGFETLRTFKPLVAAGAQKPLGDQLALADYFRKSRRTVERTC